MVSRYKVEVRMETANYYTVVVEAGNTAEAGAQALNHVENEHANMIPTVCDTDRGSGGLEVSNCSELGDTE